MVSLKDIAEESGYSLATVSRVINNSRPVKPEIREKVLRIAKEMSYFPNVAARTLAKKSTDAIGVVVTNLHDPFFHDLISGFEAGAVETEFNVVFCSAMGKEIHQKQRYVRYLSNGVVDGIVLYGSYCFDEAMVKELHSTGFPFILIESTVEGVNTNNFLIDNVGGEYNAMCYLYEHGHRKIAYIAGKQVKRVAVDRLNGYLSAIRDLNLDIPDEFIKVIEDDQQDGWKYMDAFLSLPTGMRPTAVLCYDDAVASYAIRSALRAGLSIPRDISVMGFDNQTIPPDGYRGPAITSVSQPLFEIGRDSILLLSQYLRGAKKEYITKIYATSIAEKESVAYCKEN